MEEDQQRSWKTKCLPPLGPQKVVMRQVIGECTKQKSIDVHMCVPRRKPGIEQIIDVFVKKVRISSVEIITDRVIVRGHFEVKAIYVACLPAQPVHAIEIRRVRFSVAVPIYGARRGMDAEANVFVEYVDYDCVDKWRLYKHKYNKHDDCDDDWDGHWKHKHHHDDCDDDWDGHWKHKHHHDDCDDDWDGHWKHKHHHDDCDDDWDGHWKHKHHHGGREFDVSVILGITAKVMADREVVLNHQSPMPGLPVKPKG
ncbi:DUF3794 domain-containing protein|uniref:SipL SPOCS domain-containing protein n=1 Tax=Dendrosporobacter quercicolus TaxID=146817 RepID=A0A1G9W197_9FIRM|nr:DUF3794 domain-containing protein [Dendrosporobacter quercicolus]NSL47756.1 DUF3794 domain-containing protein [Dendrosporobacter quercicolus DSM 1736]SDM77845.1 protein of unknown function [Dendrosporobacter quercicolus]